MKKLLAIFMVIVFMVTFSYAQITITKEVGEEFSVLVSAADPVTNVIGLSTWIRYDPAIIGVVDSDPSTTGTQVSATDLGFLTNGVLLANIKTTSGVEEPGTLIVGYSSIPATPTSGSGNLFKIKFKGLSPGVTGVSFIDGHKDLQNSSGSVPAEWINSVMEVLEEEIIPRIIIQIVEP